MPGNPARIEDVRRYLGRREEVTFLAQGEYSLNFLVRESRGDSVARLVAGTQVHYALESRGIRLRAALPPHVRLEVGDEVPVRLPAESLWVLKV